MIKSDSSKYQQLVKYLQQNKKKSQALMTRMENTLNEAQKTKNHLQIMGKRMNNWQQGYKKLLKKMAENMIIPIQNPLKISYTSNCIEVPCIKPMKFVVERMMNYDQIVFLTGAGVSSASGIPTFRGADGIYKMKFKVDQTQYEPQEFISYNFFKNNRQVIWKWMKNFHNLVSKNKRNKNHQNLDQICQILSEKFKKKVLLLTTNIDGYHKTNKIISNNYQIHEIHGNVKYQICQKCGNKQKLPQKFSQGILEQNLNNFQTKDIKNKQESLSKINLKCSKCQSNQIRPNILFFDEKYGGEFGGSFINHEKSFPLVFSIGSSLQTGLSAKIVLQAQQTVEVNKKTVIQCGKVYQFQQTCESFLQQLLKMIRK